MKRDVNGAKNILRKFIGLMASIGKLKTQGSPIYLGHSWEYWRGGAKSSLKVRFHLGLGSKLKAQN